MEKKRKATEKTLARSKRGYTGVPIDVTENENLCTSFNFTLLYFF